MSVYKEIIEWSLNKPDFIRDGLRRLIVNPNLLSSDIDELVKLLKKEVGFTGITINSLPITINDIPVQVHLGNKNAKIISIENPININALYHRAKLEFDINGLSIVYGNNGSGKSSYSRLLKKLCWSRHKNIELRKNVYTNDLTPQSATISFDVAGSVTPFLWNSGQTSSALNTVFVFDDNCANIYLNNENNTEYKPVGIDLLEGLIKVCSEVDGKLNAELGLLKIVKPQLDSNIFSKTNVFTWYNTIEGLKFSEINLKLQFTQENLSRKNELSQLLKNNNPLEENKVLQQKIARFITVRNSFRFIEMNFSSQNIKNLNQIKNDFITKRDAYALAQQTLKGDDPISGVGSETWRLLWNAAKQFAITEVHPQSQAFPDADSFETCVFCQQTLNTDAKARLKRFNAFVEDLTSKDFFNIENLLRDKINEVKNIKINITDTFNELKTDRNSFEFDLELFEYNVKESKQEIIDSLQFPEYKQIVISNFFLISTEIENEIKNIEIKITANNSLLGDRAKHENEFLELNALEYLTTQKNNIATYHNEYIRKYYINLCKSKINVAIISRKIGEILESKAIELQHEEFIKHLNLFNKDIATKISIKKTRTTSGATFQKCTFTNIKEPLINVLSEGEQKIIALSNFLSECTIDNATNTIVFDDPVTSLDQDYRETIAKIIIELSSTRQVIVLTHDLYFVRLLIDIHKSTKQKECTLIGLIQNKGLSGIVSDEIPYLARNVQERIDTIKKQLVQIKALPPNKVGEIDTILDSSRKKFRMLLEKSVEDLLANKSIERFSKNINLKSGNLSSFVVVEYTDIQLILSLFGKYSVTEHDGSIQTLPNLPDENEIDKDLKDFALWKEDFSARLKAFKQANGIK